MTVTKPYALCQVACVRGTWAYREVSRHRTAQAAINAAAFPAAFRGGLYRVLSHLTGGVGVRDRRAVGGVAGAAAGLPSGAGRGRSVNTPDPMPGGMTPADAEEYRTEYERWLDALEPAHD